MHRKSKIVETTEDFRKLELEYCHFLGKKGDLLYQYIEKLKLSNEQYSKEDKIRELEEEREYIQRLVRVKEETLEPDLFY